MKILRAADYRTMPWKNGMGSTTEIAIFPAHAKLDDFDWRVSMAQVASDGPFSSFAGIDRTLLVLDGAGIDLSVAGSAPVRIDGDSVHDFPGDQPTSARLIDGPITDLNVMSRRSAVTHRVHRLKLMGRLDFTVSTKTLLMVEQGPITLVASSAETLQARDAILVDTHTDTLTLESDRPSSVIVAEFR